MKKILVACFIILCILITFVVLLSYFFVLQTSPSPKPAAVDQQAEKLFKLCEKKKSGDFCYADVFSAFAKDHSLATTLQVLEKVQEKDSRARSCHFIAHAIAAEELIKSPGDWKKVMATMPVDQCTGGFVMGVMEGEQLRNKDFVVNEETIPQVCSLIHKKSNSEKTCAHIMGHLLLVEQHGDVSEAIAVCTKTKQQYQLDCYNGVFMESVTRENLVTHGIGKDLVWDKTTAAAQQSLCQNYTGAIQQACWRELSHMFVYITRSYPPDVYKSCSQAPTQSMQHECYIHGVGIMVLSSRFSDKHFHLLCAPYIDDAEHQEACMKIVVSTLLTSSAAYKHRVDTFCNTFAEPKKRSCILLKNKT